MIESTSKGQQVEWVREKRRLLDLATMDAARNFRKLSREYEEGKKRQNDMDGFVKNNSAAMDKLLKEGNIDQSSLKYAQMANYDLFIHNINPEDTVIPRPTITIDCVNSIIDAFNCYGAKFGCDAIDNDVMNNLLYVYKNASAVTAFNAVVTYLSLKRTKAKDQAVLARLAADISGAAGGIPFVGPAISTPFEIASTLTGNTQSNFESLLEMARGDADASYKIAKNTIIGAYADIIAADNIAEDNSKCIKSKEKSKDKCADKITNERSCIPYLKYKYEGKGQKCKEDEEKKKKYD